MQSKKCLAVIDNKQCGLELECEHEQRAYDSIITQYRCAMGHRTHVVVSRRPVAPTVVEPRPRPKSNS
jgi:hypothetical protein